LVAAVVVVALVKAMVVFLVVVEVVGTAELSLEPMVLQIQEAEEEARVEKDLWQER
jgi:hypothetical protein